MTRKHPKIKLSGISGLSDARYAAAAGIDYLGFCFDPVHPRYIPPVKAKEISGWTTGSQLVGEFGEQDSEEIESIIEVLELDLIEINSSLSVDQVNDFSTPVILKIDLSGYNNSGLKLKIDAIHNYCHAIHIYADAPHYIDEGTLKHICRKTNVIWGLPFSEPRTIMETYAPYAFNITAKPEEKTGLADFGDLELLLDKIRDTD